MSRSLPWFVVAVLAFLRIAFAQTPDASTQPDGIDLSHGPRPGQIKNLITFGDSYSDINLPGDNGTAWPLYAAFYGNFKLFPFARAGATCSNNLTFRPFPSIFESQLPLFFQERSNGSLSIRQDETMYTLWIGTNDVGSNALLTGSQPDGVSVVDTTACAVNWIKTLYDAGGRNFVFQNMIPLQHTILYSSNSYFTHYWTAQRNSTEWSVFITELVLAGNALSKFMLQDIVPKLPGAHVGLFDSHALFTDIINNPSEFLNGTAPFNVTGSIRMCSFQENERTTDPGNCTFVTGTDRDSYIWFDELHPSEQADRQVARHLVDGIQRKSTKYLTWLS